jgi:hypothetical protein
MGQKNDSTVAIEKQRRNDENLELTANASPASRTLHQRLSSTVIDDERVAILQAAVKSGDRSIVPYLEARREMRLGPAQELDLALVALGATEYVNSAIEDLKSEDAGTRYWAVWRLARFNTKEAFRKLYELLDDNKSRDDHRGANDYVIEPMSWVTMEILSSTVEDPPKDKDAHNAAAWKAWFARNKQLIEWSKHLKTCDREAQRTAVAPLFCLFERLTAMIQ